MISEKLKSIILKELDLSDFDIENETKAYEVPGWDSLNHINIILAIENDYNIRFKNIELLKLKNIGELQNLIDQNTK
jgi:acyl carrier protein